MMSGRNSNSAPAIPGREFEFTLQDFAKLQKLVIEHTGIVLSDAKHNMVYGRLARRLRATGITNFSEYLGFLMDDEDELVNFINAVTTNLTSFFREKHHFEYLKTTVFPALEKQNAATRRIRIWSAGCSTGEEPYSLAITIREYFSAKSGWDIKILASDLDTNVIAHGERGVYDMERVQDLPRQQLTRWFVRGKGSNAGKVKVKPELQDLIEFRQVNLLQSWPFRGPFDFMFCRNVVIYFDMPTKVKLFARYADILKSEGFLFIGHSESLFKVTDRFQLIGNTIYQKKD